jgi:hypothetical protein
MVYLIFSEDETNGLHRFVAYNYVTTYMNHSVVAKGGTVRRSNPGAGEILLIRPDRPWDSSSPL